MKVFWALMAVICVAAVVLLTADLKGRGSTNSPPAPIAQPSPPQPVVAPSLVTETNQGAQDSSPASVPHTTSEVPAQAAPKPPKADAPQPEPEAIQAKPEQETVPAAPQANPPTEVKPPAAAPPEPAESENLLIKMREEIERERAAAAARKAAEQAVPKPESPPAATGPAPAAGIFGQASAEHKPDGTLLVDGKYVVSGKGTQSEPYKITWDHLISAERDYAPKEGKKTIPARVTALDDTWVEITGYIAFPLMAQDTDECLSMMNQWDGCCIGVPPTPYDAIEVRLNEAVAGDARLTTYGVIKGRFKVDPHLVGGWLVGLYVIESGKLTPKAFGGVAP